MSTPKVSHITPSASQNSHIKPKRKILQRFRDLAHEELELSYLVEGFIPDESKTLLIGESGVGKSTFAAQLCTALQAGTSFLDMNTLQTECLYFQVDASLPIWQAQIKRIAPHSKAWSLHGLETGALDKPECIEIVKRIIEHLQPGFVVFDALNTLTGKDINTKAVMPIIYLIDQLCTDASGRLRSYVLIHHPSKDNKRGTSGAAGYHGIAAMCDTYISLSLSRLRVEKSRVVKNKVFKMTKDTEGRWELLESSEGMKEKLYDAELDIPL